MAEASDLQQPNHTISGRAHSGPLQLKAAARAPLHRELGATRFQVNLILMKSKSSEKGYERLAIVC